MGMMDGGINFKDICHKCDAIENGGTMKRYIHDRNKNLNKFLTHYICSFHEDPTTKNF